MNDWATHYAGLELDETPWSAQSRIWRVTVVKYRIRKRVALCMTHPDTPGLSEAVAYFTTEAKARKFAGFIDALTKPTRHLHVVD